MPCTLDRSRLLTCCCALPPDAADLRELVAAGQQGRVLRVLRAYDTFSEIDGCGEHARREGASSWLVAGVGLGIARSP